jgi:Tfp pilus assembly protein PilZ
MEFVLPGSSDPLSVSGMVVWIRKAKKKEQAETGIGVRFTDLDEVARARFWEAISSRLS